MTRLLRLVTAALAWLVPAAVQAQLDDLKPAVASYEHYPSARVRGAVGTDGSEEVGFHVLKTGLTVPIALNDGGTLLIPGFKYTLMDVITETSAADEAVASVDALHALSLSAGMWQRFDEHWSVYGTIGGGLASDLSGDLASDEWVFSAQLLALYTIVPAFTLGAGVGYDRRTGEVAPLPLLAINWQPSHAFMIRGVVPVTLNIRYRPVDALTLALESALEGERYHLDRRRLGVEHAEVAYSVVKLGLAATAHIAELIHTRMYGGAALCRRFKVYVDDDEQGGGLELGSGGYAGIELWLGPSGWKDG